MDGWISITGGSFPARRERKSNGDGNVGSNWRGTGSDLRLEVSFMSMVDISLLFSKANNEEIATRKVYILMDVMEDNSPKITVFKS
jgi:hypothetical protein